MKQLGHRDEDEQGQGQHGMQPPEDQMKLAEPVDTEGRGVKQASQPIAGEGPWGVRRMRGGKPQPFDDKRAQTNGQEQKEQQAVLPGDFQGMAAQGATTTEGTHQARHEAETEGVEERFVDQIEMAPQNVPAQVIIDRHQESTYKQHCHAGKDQNVRHAAGGLVHDLALAQSVDR
jgi:hypothetical protein